MLSNITIGILIGFAAFILIRQITTVLMMWKVNGIVILPHLLLLFILLTFASCEKEELIPDTCINGDCSAYFELNYPQDENGYYRVKLNYSGEYYPWFVVDVYANATNKVWWYNDMPVVEAEFYGDKYLELPNEIIPVVQETQIYLSGKGEKLNGKRVIGPIPPQMKGDTLNVEVEMYWDAASNSILKNYSLKFIME